MNKTFSAYTNSKRITITVSDNEKLTTNISFDYSNGRSVNINPESTAIYISYKDVISYFKEVYDNNDNLIRIFVLFNNKFICYSSNEYFDEVNMDFVYTVENDYIQTLLNNICYADKEQNSAIICKPSSDKKKKNILLLRYSVFEILLIAADYKFNDKKLINEFDLQTKSKVRHIIAPQGDFMTSLKSLNVLLQKKFDRKNDLFQVAYKKGKSIVDNAIIHKDNKYVFKTDFKDFFPSCKRELVEKALNFLFDDYNGYNLDVIKDLFYSTILYKGGLFIGSPISGTVANYVISDAVLDMRNTALRYGVKMTVYADDITFSSEKVLYKKSVLDIVNGSLQRCGLFPFFKLNSKKCIGLSNQRRSITGIVFNHNDEMTTHRFRYNHIRQSLYQLEKGEKGNFNMNELKGQIAFVLPTDYSEKYQKLFTKYRNVLLNNKLISEENLEKFLSKTNPENV